jgi:Fe2+ or Zn2+ uptake regulation protein
MNNLDKITKLFEESKDKEFAPKDVAKTTKLSKSAVYKALSRLTEEGIIVKVAKGRYRFQESDLQDQIRNARYLNTIGKTCEIAIHELMIAESLLNEEESKAEIEHQLAYFARHLVKVLWELEQETYRMIKVDEHLFERAEKIHEWSNYVFNSRKEELNGK